jgi:hypothetical protein
MIIEGKANVIRFTQSAALSALALEVKTGMTFSSRGSGLQACQIQGLLPMGRTTRKAGLKKAVKEMKRLYPDWEVPNTVQSALNS